MTIQRRARITTAVLILFVVGTVAVLFWNSSQVGEGIKTIDATSRAVDSAFMMRVLMVDYLAGRDARTLKEWEIHRENLGRMLNEMASGSTDETLLADLKGNYQTVSALADKVVRLLSARDTADRFQASDAKGMIDKLMLLKLEQLVDAAHHLSKATQSLTLGRRYFVQQIIIAAGVLGLAFIVINVYLMRKSVVQPLKLLSNEADKIGAGDFAYVPEMKSDDEVGNLGRAFNAMVARLQRRDIALRQARDEVALRLEERSAALQRTTAYNNLLQAIQRVQTQFIANTDSEELFQTLLQDLLTVSESEFGFIGELLYTEGGQPYLKDRAITDIAWDEESRKVYERFAEDRGLEFHDIHGLWGAAILSGEPVVSNDPFNDPRRTGLPGGHPPLNAFLGIPFLSEGKVIGMAGLANRPGGYDRDMVEFIQPLGSTCASIIEAYRNENRRRAAEQRLFETNQRLQALMDALPVGISFTDDTSCERITGNPCLFDQFEMTPDANISASSSNGASAGRSVQYRHNGRLIPGTELPLQRAIAENRVILPLQLEVRLPSGRRWFAEASAAPIRDEQGAVVGGVAVTVDITERRLVEDELKEAKEQLEIRVRARTAELGEANRILQEEMVERKRAQEAMTAERQRLYDILETMPAMVCLLTPDYHVAFANRSFREKFGEDNGRQCFDYCFGMKEPCEFCETYNVLKTGKPHHWQLLSPDGSVIDAYDFPFTDSDGSPLILEIDIDITELKSAQAQRESLIAELETKNAELERFTYSVSHDLKSPLITIRTFIGFIEQDLPTGNIDDVKKDLERISNAAEKMGQLLDQILELSRVGRIFNPPTEISMADLTGEVLELLSGIITQRAVEVTVADDLPVLYGDRPRLFEVLQNLVENAVKFMGDQPHPRIEVGARQEEGETIVYVRDNGIGIDPAYKERVFGLFDKLDEKTQGTGIGLALVKRIVEVHGGRIWVESQGRGQGSSFYFALPCNVSDDER